MSAKQVLQTRARRIVAGETDGTGGVLIQSVHGNQALAELCTDPIHKGRAGATGSWDNQDPRGLVDDEQMLVLMDDRHGRHDDGNVSAQGQARQLRGARAGCCRASPSYCKRRRYC